MAIGWAERDVTPDLKGALVSVPRKNFAAITEPKELANLLRAMHAYNGYVVALTALKLTPLLFVRPGELRAAEWSEFNLDVAEWRIPAAKMKMKVEHGAIAEAGGGTPARAAPRHRTRKVCLPQLAYRASVYHSFREIARTILDEMLNERVDLIEHQLAHRVIDPNGRAYNRTAHLPARAAMMQHWADYLDKLSVGANVIPIRPAPGVGPD